jgi:hypothetical protein
MPDRFMPTTKAWTPANIAPSFRLVIQLATDQIFLAIDQAPIFLWGRLVTCGRLVIGLLLAARKVLE